MAPKSDFRASDPATSRHENSRTGQGGEHDVRERGERHRDRDWQADRATQAEEGDAHGVEQIVDRYPYASLLTGVGLGFGFGLALTLLLPRRQPSWYERYVPESMQHLPERLKRAPEAIGSYLPSSWKHS
jgi:hypothetical protein